MRLSKTIFNPPREGFDTYGPLELFEGFLDGYGNVPVRYFSPTVALSLPRADDPRGVSHRSWSVYPGIYEPGGPDGMLKATLAVARYDSGSMEIEGSGVFEDESKLVEILETVSARIEALRQPLIR